MRLLLVRHGEAWEEGTQPGRPLTPRGEEEARRAGRYLARMGASPSAFWCSPKLRAEQTAVRLGACLGDRHPQRRPDLEPDADPAKLKEELESLGGEVLWVSHLPLLPRLASLLLTGREDRLGFLWEPGGVLALRREGRGGWRLERFTPPDGMEP